MIDFNNLVDNFLKQELRNKTIGRYYPSEVGSCLRKTHYSYKNPKEIDKELLKIFRVGSMLHKFVVDVLNSEKNREVELVMSESPFQLHGNDYLISGRIDSVIVVKIDNKKYVVEVKSTSSLNFVKEASKSNIFQLMIYLKAMDIKDGILLYIEKNNLKTKQFEFEFDEELYKEAMERFNEINDSLVKNELPYPEARVKKEMNWLCKNCQYRDECFSETSDEELAKFIQ